MPSPDPFEVIGVTLVLATLCALAWFAFRAIRTSSPSAPLFAFAFGLIASAITLGLGPLFVLPTLVLFACVIDDARDRVLTFVVLATSWAGALGAAAVLFVALPFWPGGLETILAAYVAFGSVVTVLVGAFAKDLTFPFTRGAITVFGTMGLAGLVAAAVFFATFYASGDFVNRGKPGAASVLLALTLANVVLASLGLRLHLRLSTANAIAITVIATSGSVFLVVAFLLLGPLWGL